MDTALAVLPAIFDAISPRISVYERQNVRYEISRFLISPGIGASRALIYFDLL